VFLRARDRPDDERQGDRVAGREGPMTMRPM
jgi:hypothetical protein